MQTSLYLGFVLILVNLAVYLISIPAGLVVSCFMLLYFAVVLTLQFYNKPVIINEMVSFATQYGQVQKVLLRELEIPYAMLDEYGRIIWTNEAFERVVHKEKGYRKSITSLFHRSPEKNSLMKWKWQSLILLLKTAIILRKCAGSPWMKWFQTVTS